jgi:hypothetical protein
VNGLPPPPVSWAADSPTERLPMGTALCGCGWPVAYLDEDDSEQPWENRRHVRRGVVHVWPQRHVCGPMGDDECQVCAGCVDC